MTDATPPGPPAPASSDPGARITLAMLCFVYVLNFLDRQLISILAKPIQDGLGVTDGQSGRITGFYFALFYCFIAIPVGWLADRTSQVKVLALACALWSGATAACGMVGNYGQLVVARMLVGIARRGGVPPSYAIISDAFPRERRTTAMAIFNLGLAAWLGAGRGLRRLRSHRPLAGACPSSSAYRAARSGSPPPWPSSRDRARTRARADGRRQDLDAPRRSGPGPACDHRAVFSATR
ncbi:MFS transporter [Caulobacter segnis]